MSLNSLRIRKGCKLQRRYADLFFHLLLLFSLFNQLIVLFFLQLITKGIFAEVGSVYEFGTSSQMCPEFDDNDLSEVDPTPLSLYAI